MKKTDLTVRPLSGIDLSGVPEVIRVLPKGHVSSTKGDFEVDDRDIAGIIRQFKARRLDLVIDYEHPSGPYGYDIFHRPILYPTYPDSTCS